MRSLIVAIVVAVAIVSVNAADEYDDGLKPSLKDLRMAVEAAWELQKRASDPVEKRNDAQEAELQAFVNSAYKDVMKRKEQAQDESQLQEALKDEAASLEKEEQQEKAAPSEGLVESMKAFKAALDTVYEVKKRGVTKRGTAEQLKEVMDAGNKAYAEVLKRANNEERAQFLSAMKEEQERFQQLDQEVAKRDDSGKSLIESMKSFKAALDAVYEVKKRGVSKRGDEQEIAKLNEEANDAYAEVLKRANDEERAQFLSAMKEEKERFQQLEKEVAKRDDSGKSLVESMKSFKAALDAVFELEKRGVSKRDANDEQMLSDLKDAANEAYADVLKVANEQERKQFLSAMEDEAAKYQNLAKRGE